MTLPSGVTGKRWAATFGCDPLNDALAVWDESLSLEFRPLMVETLGDAHRRHVVQVYVVTRAVVGRHNVATRREAF